MSAQECLVLERSDGWLIIAGEESEELASDASLNELVVCVKLVSKLAGITNLKCVLAPASTSCFFAKLEVSSEIDVRDRTALAFELEDHLPIDAESMVADFVVVPTSKEDKTVSAVAIEVARWKEITEALESADILVVSVVPAAVLATRCICNDLRFTDTFDLLLISGLDCDLLKIQNEAIVAWKHTQFDAKQLRRQKLLDEGGSDFVMVVGADESQQSVIQNIYGDFESKSESTESQVTRGAALLLDKASPRWFELRRDQLGPTDPLRPIQTHLRLVTLAAASCLVAVVISGWWRTQRIESEIVIVRSQQQELFRSAFPDTRVPGALLRRVRSEHARVMGSRGANSQVDIPESAPEILRVLLSALPDDVRFRVTRLDILNGQIDIDLQVRVPTDAGKLAMSLESAGFDVKPPVTTQRDAKTFDSILEATWVGPVGQTPNRDQISVRTATGTEAAG